MWRFTAVMWTPSTAGIHTKRCTVLASKHRQRCNYSHPQRKKTKTHSDTISWMRIMSCNDLEHVKGGEHVRREKEASVIVSSSNNTANTCQHEWVCTMFWLSRSDWLEGAYEYSGHNVFKDLMFVMRWAWLQIPVMRCKPLVLHPAYICFL